VAGRGGGAGGEFEAVAAGRLARRLGARTLHAVRYSQHAPKHTQHAAHTNTHTHTHTHKHKHKPTLTHSQSHAPPQVYAFFLGAYQVAWTLGVAGYILLVLDLFGIGLLLAVVGVPPGTSFVLLWYG
jgi:hypothetical protein